MENNSIGQQIVINGLSEPTMYGSTLGSSGNYEEEEEERRKQ